jgi:hypothetical protein
VVMSRRGGLPSGDPLGGVVALANHLARRGTPLLAASTLRPAVIRASISRHQATRWWSPLKAFPSFGSNSIRPGSRLEEC